MARQNAPIRNNNPGGIRGAKGRYKTKAEGYMALNSLLYRRYNYRTALEIFSEYAPKFEIVKGKRIRTKNDPEVYAKNVIAYLRAEGFDVNDKTILDLTDPKLRGALTCAIARQEGGNKSIKKELAMSCAEKYNPATDRNIRYSGTERRKQKYLATRKATSTPAKKTEPKPLADKVEALEKQVDRGVAGADGVKHAPAEKLKVETTPEEKRVASKESEKQEQKTAMVQKKPSRPTARNNWNNPGLICSLRTRRPKRYASLQEGYVALTELLKEGYSNLTPQEIWKKFTGLRRAKGDKLLDALKKQGLEINADTKLDLNNPEVLGKLTFAVAELRSGGKALGGEVEARQCIASVLGLKDATRLAKELPQPAKTEKETDVNATLKAVAKTLTPEEQHEQAIATQTAERLVAFNQDRIQNDPEKLAQFLAMQRDRITSIKG